MGKSERRLILTHHRAPGDIVVLTAAVRDLHRCYPGRFITDVRTPSPALWHENPYLQPLREEDPDVEVIECDHPRINRANRSPKHCLFGFIDFLNERLGLQIEPTEFRGDIHLHPDEQRWMPQVMERTGEDTPYWIIVAGGKQDYTIKWWEARRWQQVVDHFRGRIQFVQVGHADHAHPALDGVIDLRGKTHLRQLVRLVYHAQGVACPLTSLMHLAAAVPVRPGRPQNRACVVVAGGREPMQWAAYPHHQFIHTNGQLLCCDQGGCWKSRTVALGDGDERDASAHLCVQPVEVGENTSPARALGIPSADPADYLPRCMDMITAEDVIRRIEGYYTGGAYQYLTTAQAAAGALASVRTPVKEVRPSSRQRPQEEGVRPVAASRADDTHRMIGVTIGVGEKWEMLARLAAESCEESTGLQTFILGADAVKRHGLSTPHHLKYKLFHEFPDADSILYFDADLIFLQPFDARAFAGRRDFVCVRDRYETEEVVREEAGTIRLRPELYFNSGFFIIQRAVHAVFLEKAQWLTGRFFSRFKDQTYLNGARHMLSSPILYLPREYNQLGFDRPVETAVPPRQGAPAPAKVGLQLYDPSGSGLLRSDPSRVVIGHFHAIDERPAEEIERYHHHWRARGRVAARQHSAETQAQLCMLLTQPQPASTPAPRPGPVTEEERHYRELLERAVAARHSYPKKRFAGRGIVICGGGAKYFPCAWVTVKLLRHHGCTLPIELWYLGANEMTAAMRALLTPLGVEPVDGLEVRRRHPVPSLFGWELKAFALQHCRFAEVLLLDADNVAVRDPSFLFDEPEYLAKGAIFWPDFATLAAEKRIWSLMGIAYREEPAFESGQILIHKEKSWKALKLAGHLNAQSAFYYRHIHGDKDTFHMAWARLDQPYAMPSRRLEALEATMCQHDLQGRRLFQHRNADKWRIDGRNRRIPGFQHEEICRQFIDELRQRWFPVTLGVRRWNALEATPELRLTARALASNAWNYHRVGHDCRVLRLRPDGLVGKGGAEQEIYWHLRESPSGPVLEFFSATARTCRLQRENDGVWRGRWEVYERLPVELACVPPRPRKASGAATTVGLLSPPLAGPNGTLAGAEIPRAREAARPARQNTSTATAQ